MKVIFLAIGDELVRGETLERNGHYLSKSLTQRGIALSGLHVLPDSVPVIVDFIRSHPDSLIVTSGGLGPTDDDLTRQAIAEAFQVSLERDEVAERWVCSVYERRGKDMARCNYRQADLPKGARPLQNPNGTAPGFVLQIGPTSVTVLPGVPSEFRAMIDAHLDPVLMSVDIRPAPLIESIMRVQAMSESDLHELLQSTQGFEKMSIRSYPRFPEICLKISSEHGAAAVDSFVKAVGAKLGWKLFAQDEGLSLTAQVIQKLTNQGLTVSLAESCTGGLISSMITAVPGASATYLGGVVVYSNEAKINLTGVDPQSIETNGAVSDQVARQLALGVRERFDTTFGISVTGIAGPGGGTQMKPVGTVYMALATPEHVFCWENCLIGRSRERFQRSVAALALGRLWRQITEQKT